jgi:phosphoglycerol transferase MdoB-like AlkP superfamily enzyme
LRALLLLYYTHLSQIRTIIRKIASSVYGSLLGYLLLAMVFFMLCRVIFYLLNTSFFPDMTWSRLFRIMMGGLRFDLAAVLYLNSLLLLAMIIPLQARFTHGYRTALYWLFVIVNSFALIPNLADCIYYRFTLRRTTLSFVNQFENEQNVSALLFQFLIDYWYIALIWVILVYLLARLARQIRYEGPQMRNPWLFYLSGLAAIPLVVYLFIGGVRGGFAHSTRPITLSNAAAYAREPKDIHLVLNTPFALMRTAKANVIEKVNYFPDETSLNNLFDPRIFPKDSLPFRQQNVVVIILESFSKEFIGAYHQATSIQNYQGYTPFLDSLIGVSRAYQFSFANGRKSIDAMPSVLASIPSIEVPYVLSHYSGNKINSLASLLKPKGYQTAFFHGAPNGSMGFDAFANLAGFDAYYGKDEYNNDNDYDGIWGIWDEPFLQYYAKTLNTFREPFCAALFTVSSHHPYKLPEGYENRFQGGSRPIYKTIQYTDRALREFFKTASQMPWYENTLFVISADHASAEIEYPEYNTAWGYFSIPVFFFKPGAGWHSFEPEIIQQVDVMPTVLSYLQYDEPYLAFGRNVFAKDKTPFAFNYLNNNYQLFEGDYLMLFDGKQPVGLYNFQTDVFLKTDLKDQLPDQTQRMKARIQAYIQQYNNRMVDDNLTMEGPQRLKINNHP